MAAPLTCKSTSSPYSLLEYIYSTDSIPCNLSTALLSLLLKLFPVALICSAFDGVNMAFNTTLPSFSPVKSFIVLFLYPSPNATMVITAAIPIIIPNIVKKDLFLFLIRFLKAEKIRTLSFI